MDCNGESPDHKSAGGFALGSVQCIFEDSPSNWHGVFLKHFLVQGVASTHTVCLFSQDNTILGKLPGVFDSSTPSSSHDAKCEDDELRIAWRYKSSLQQQNSAGVASDSRSAFCQRYDRISVYAEKKEIVVMASDLEMTSDCSVFQVRHESKCQRVCV